MRRFARLLATSLTAYALFIRPRLLRCLDNFGRRSSESIHQEWQEVNVGDFLGSPNVSELERKAWQVAALEPQRFLGLRASIDLLGRHFDPSQERPRYYSDSLWGFY